MEGLAPRIDKIETTVTDIQKELVKSEMTDESLQRSVEELKDELDQLKEKSKEYQEAYSDFIEKKKNWSFLKKEVVVHVVKYFVLALLVFLAIKLGMNSQWLPGAPAEKPPVEGTP